MTSNKDSHSIIRKVLKDSNYQQFEKVLTSDNGFTDNNLKYIDRAAIADVLSCKLHAASVSIIYGRIQEHLQKLQKESSKPKLDYTDVKTFINQVTSFGYNFYKDKEYSNNYSDLGINGVIYDRDHNFSSLEENITMRYNLKEKEKDKEKNRAFYVSGISGSGKTTMLHYSFKKLNQSSICDNIFNSKNCMYVHSTYNTENDNVCDYDLIIVDVPDVSDQFWNPGVVWRFIYELINDKKRNFYAFCEKINKQFSNWKDIVKHGYVIYHLVHHIFPSRKSLIFTLDEITKIEKPTIQQSIINTITLFLNVKFKNFVFIQPFISLMNDKLLIDLVTKTNRKFNQLSIPCLSIRSMEHIFSNMLNKDEEFGSLMLLTGGLPRIVDQLFRSNKNGTINTQKQELISNAGQNLSQYVKSHEMLCSILKQRSKVIDKNACVLGILPNEESKENDKTTWNDLEAKSVVKIEDSGVYLIPIRLIQWYNGIKNTRDDKLVILLRCIVNGLMSDSKGVNFENIIRFNFEALSLIYNGETVSLKKYFNHKKPEIDPSYQNNNNKDNTLVPTCSSDLTLETKIIISTLTQQQVTCFYPHRDNLTYYWNEKISNNKNTPPREIKKLLVPWVKENEKFKSSIVYSKNSNHELLDLLVSFETPKKERELVFWIQVKNTIQSFDHRQKYLEFIPVLENRCKELSNDRERTILKKNNRHVFTWFSLEDSSCKFPFQKDSKVSPKRNNKRLDNDFSFFIVRNSFLKDFLITPFRAHVYYSVSALYDKILDSDNNNNNNDNDDDNNNNNNKHIENKNDTQNDEDIINMVSNFDIYEAGHRNVMLQTRKRKKYRNDHYSIHVSKSKKPRKG